MPRKTSAQTPHFFDERIRCPALILGASHSSGHDTGSYAKAKNASFSADPERFRANDQTVS